MELHKIIEQNPISRHGGWPPLSGMRTCGPRFSRVPSPRYRLIPYRSCRGPQSQLPHVKRERSGPCVGKCTLQLILGSVPDLLAWTTPRAAYVARSLCTSNCVHAFRLIRRSRTLFFLVGVDGSYPAMECILPHWSRETKMRHMGDGARTKGQGSRI